AQRVANVELDPGTPEKRGRLGRAGADEHVVRVDSYELAHAVFELDFGKDTRDARPLLHEELHARPGPDTRARGLRLRKQRDAHSLFCARRTTDGTRVRALAVGRRARNFLRRPTHRRRATREDLGALRMRRIRKRHADRLLRPFEMRLELFG